MSDETHSFRPADRYVVDQAWWTVSELCRRNSRLMAYYETPMDGFYGGPSVFDGERAHGRVFFNQVGRIHFEDVANAPEPMAFATGIAADDPHEIVKSIERVMNWSRPSADATTPRSLTYRVISAVMTNRLHDRDRWSVVGGGPLEDGYGQPEEPKHFTEFQGARARFRSSDPPDFWAVQRESRTAVLLDEDATLYRRSHPPQDLMAVYTRRRKLRDAVAYVLDEID
ncbi:hypothetical protein [Rathayibacter festucae]|uniref:TY-Chap2 family putative peptide chaperone n=1 Tax=Rathayibacter festucae TaxID=110937 RepID=UPI002A699845|nr:hypothetical protein [Rathayibacter festucae]MDY0912863.1 hypothetical protein [Rathayibacter festucae]